MTIDSKKIDFYQLVENIPNSILLVGIDGTIFYCNKAGIHFLNFDSIEDIINKNLHLFLPFDLHRICNDGLTKVIEHKEIIDRKDIRILKNHGEIADVEIMTFPFYLEDQVLAQVIIQDISGRKVAEKKLNDSEKLASLGQIAAGIVHEVKNPLTTVKGFLHLMKESPNPDYLDIMETELEKAFDTLQKLLQVSKPDLEDEPLVTIDISNKLNSIMLLFQDKVYSVDFELDLKDSNKKIVGKKNLLLKAFFNLVKNAIEAIVGNGKIRIEHYFHNDFIHIKISDTGVGIPADKLKLLGTPFYTSKPDGTGLGLTQVFTTIHDHGGNISVQSEVGKGTTFHIQLPVLR